MVQSKVSVKVKPYKQKRNGKVYIVKGYKRKKRPLGKKIKYSSVGEFYVAHDDQGNFRGSKIVLKKKTKKASKRPKTSR